jgi:CheY-like chemotaxis protein
MGSTFVLYVPLVYVSTTTPARQTDDVTQEDHDGNGAATETAAASTAGAASAYSDSTSYASAGSIAAGPATGSPSSMRTSSGADRAVYTPATRAEHLRQAGLELPDDRTSIRPGDRVMLIVEDDRNFGKVLLEVAREQGFKALIATRGDTALALAHGFRPDAITLDIFLPDIDGFTILDRLKSDSTTRHIPVSIISVDEDRTRGIKRGAFEVLTKPVARDRIETTFKRTSEFIDRPIKRLLIVEDDERDRNAIMGLIGNGNVQATAVGSAEEALEATQQDQYDCIVLDLLLPGASGFEAVELLQKQEGTRNIPIVVYTGKDLTKEEEGQLNRLVHSVIVKDVRSPERLLDETALFLHRPVHSLPEEKRKMVEQLHDPVTVLAGKRALIVDDDARNIFAMSSILERNHMQVMSAESGREAVEMLERQPEVDLILMDIMMPDMDGYETIRAIREIPRFKSLPIIAVTAKAMKGDREKCIEAGASDYITKPVDQEQLLSMMRMWLHR